MTMLRNLLLRIAVRPHLPRRTLRLRLTLLYGGLFLVSGAVLLIASDLLVSQTTAHVQLPAAPPGTVVYGSGTLVLTNGSGQQIQVSAGEPLSIKGGTGAQGGGTSQDVVQQPTATSVAIAQAQRLAAQALAVHQAETNALLLWSGVALAGMAVVSMGLGWVVAGRALRPLRSITAAARDISATSLDRRLALKGPRDEIKELGDTFDSLLARLEGAFQSQRRFVANASHELRTPLARQRAIIQVALADPAATASSLRAAHERVLASGAEEERLIEALLTLARGQAGPEHREPLDLATLTGEVLASRRSDAHARQLEIRSELSQSVTSGDPRLVERLVVNLVDNAIRHNLDGGFVEISTATQAGQAVLRVANTGPRVPEAEIDRLFQPFQRMAPERTRHGDGGTGLGLSIVRAIAEAHGAAIAARPRPEGGLEVQVSFPAPGLQV
jgi:signal transduction histidine kinase